MKKAAKLILSILICFSAAALGSAFTYQSIPTWYVTLNKPFFTPPNWLFGPVWTILYILMGIALYLLWTSPVKDKKIAYKFFFAQLILNALWSVVFFGSRNIILGFAVIVLLWIFILLTILRTYPISKTASRLLIPYIIWVTYASALNAGIMVMNSR